MMFNVSVNFNEVCFCTFLSSDRDVFLPLTPECDLDLEFGHINIVCEIPSNYALLFCGLIKFAPAGLKV